MTENYTTTMYVVSANDLKTIVKGCIAELLAEQETSRANNNLVPLSKAVELLNVDRSTLWRWDKSNYLKPVKIGTKVAYRESDLIRIKKGVDR